MKKNELKIFKNISRDGKIYCISEFIKNYIQN